MWADQLFVLGAGVVRRNSLRVRVHSNIRCSDMVILPPLGVWFRAA
jgi:hypothetical protein